MSRQRGGEHGPPPSSSRYRQSQRSKGVGSSSTKVVLDGERGYDSEMVQTAPTQVPSGYHTDQSKRSSKDLYRAALDPRRNGARLSSMPSAPSYNYGYSDDVRQDDESEQNSSLRRVKKDRRHRDQYDAVPASVWMPQVQAEPKPSRSHRRESRSRRDDEIQHDPRTDKYYYRNAPDYYRNDYAPSPLLSSTPRYQYVIDDRAGMASPPPVEVPHAFPSEAYDHYATGTPLLQPPRSVSQLRAEGLIPASPANRRHRTTRSEDVTGGMFADGTEHRPLRHQPSRSEDLRKLGHGTAPPVPAPPEEHVPLARPVHVGRSASETTVPQLPQPATPGMYSSGLAVTPARPGYVMHPQLQESFAESANASRAPVNAAMASAAIASGTTDSDSSRERRRRTRRSKQVDASPLVGDPQLPKEPTPPPVVTAGKRARTTSGRSAVVLVGEEREEDTVVYPAESSRAVESSRAPVEPSRAAEPPRAPDALRAVKDAQPIGLAIFGSMTMPTTASGIMHGGIPHVSTFVGAGPRAIGHEVSRDGLDSSRQAPVNAETPRQAEPQAAPRRGSVLDIMAEERTRKPSNSGTEERMRGLDRLGAEDHRRPSLEKGRTDPPLEKSRELPLEKGRVEGLERERGRLESIERGRKESFERGRVDALERSRVDQTFEKSKMDQSFERSRMDQSFEKSRRGSDASLDSFQSAELAASTTAPDFMSAREAMSPMSNYQSIAPSVRSAVNEARALAAEARGMVDHAGPATVVMQGKEVHLGKATIDPRSGVAVVDSLSRATIMEPHSVKAATVGHRPKERKPEPESHSRPRIPSNNMLAAEPTVHRATVDVHTRDQVPAQVIVDEEGRMTRGPAPAARATRSSFSMQRPPPQTTTPATSPPQTHPIAIPPQTHPSTSPPQTHPATTSPPQTHPAVNSPPQTHPAVTSPHPPVTSPAHVEASALPRNLQQPQPIGSSKESLVDSTHVKAHKSKSSRWFWPKSKQAEPIPKAPSPTPPQAPSASASQPRVRQTSILGGLMGHPSSKSKSKTPEPQQEMYASQDSTPSSVTLDLEPKKDESRMPRMFASIKNSLRRTPSSAKLGHGMSRSMSRLPGTTPAPPSGAPLARSASTNGHNVGSPMRTKEPLKPAPPPIPIDTAPKDSASIPPPPMSAPIVMSTAPVAAPVPAPPLSAPVLPPVAPKPVPIRDDRRPPPKDVPIIEKARTPVPNASRASIDQSTATKVTRTLVDAHGRIVDSSGRPIDASGRPIDSVGRSDKRSSTQAPPHPRAASPPLVTRPVTATRIPANQTNIFTGSQTPRAPAQPVPVPHSSSRAQGSRSGRSSRDHAQPVASSSRPSRSREPMPVPIVEPSLPAPAAELGLPTPDATPRASPTGEEVFENRAAAIQREKERERERSRERRVVVPQPDLGAVNSKLKAQADHPTGGTLKFVHRQKRAVSIASLEAVTGQEAHFRSEASSIRTVTPGPGQTSFPNRDPHEATEDWRLLQLQEDMRLNAGKLQARRESVEARGVLKKRERGGLRKAGVAFDFPGPVINEDVEDQFDAMKKADIEMTYELERRKKRYK